MGDEIPFTCCFGPRPKLIDGDSISNHNNEASTSDQEFALTAVQKAFHNQAIMEEIFSHLNYEDLKSCRLVSPGWRWLASKVMLSRKKRIKFLYYMGESKKVSSYYLEIFLQNPRLRLRLLGL